MRTFNDNNFRIVKLGFAFLSPNNLSPPSPTPFSPNTHPYANLRHTCPHQSAMSNRQDLHTLSDGPLSSPSDLRLTTLPLNHDQLTTVPRPPSVTIAKHTSHRQVPFMWGILVLFIAARADGYPIPAHPLPLLHLHRRDESESNVIGYSGLAIAFVGVVITALGLFKGWECWKDRRRSKKGVCIFHFCFLWWWE